MSNLLKLNPDFRVVLPEGATGATGEIRYQRAYKVALLLAGAPSSFKVVPESAGSRLGKLTSLDGGDVRLLGAMNGDPEPPYVELVIYPTFPNTPGRMGRGEPVILSGRPHEYPPGSDSWDLSDLGANPNGATVTSREEKLSVVSAAAEARAAAQKVTATQLDLSAEREKVNKALADTAQMQADWATAPRTLLHGTAAERRALVVDPPRRLLYLEDDTHRQLNYFPGLGWRDVYGNDPDAAPPPPDTGVY